ncbi:unnamed protein product [Rhizophagus irregularis]|nr:unnamed protein product [Rhizophagus irregularis]
MNLEELSRYAPEYLSSYQSSNPKEGGAEAEVNICCAKSACQVSDIYPEEEIIRETAQRIMRDSLGEKEVKLIAKALAETSPNPEKSLLCEDEGIYYPNHFSLESVRRDWDSYDVSNTPDKQALADVMIMLCIRSAEIKDLYHLKERGTGKAIAYMDSGSISSRRLGDSGDAWTES